MTDEIESDLELVLEPGEVVLWCGRPYYPYFRSEAWAAFVFGLIALAASAPGWLICYFVIRNAISNGCYQNLPALPIAVLPAGVFGWIGIESVRAPWRCRRWLARACYAVTDRRVIVRAAPGYAGNGMLPEPESELYAFTPQQARARQRRHRHGRRVDLVFVTEKHRRSNVEIGILGAEDWQGANRAMSMAFGVPG